jgi:hypothetical protein
MKAFLFLSLAVMLATSRVWASDLAAPIPTPSAIDTEIPQKNVESTVCVKGYTKTVHPPAYYTNELKKRQMREYVCTDMNSRYYGEDRLVPFSVGGNTSDPINLWAEPRIGEWNADKKDQLELVIYRIVCAQEITLCGSKARDGDKLDIGIQEKCVWRSVSSWSMLWSCRVR